MDYRGLLLLRAARESGIIDALTTDASAPGEVAAATGVTEQAARVVVQSLTDQGFLTHVDGAGYEPTNRLLGFLTTTDLRSIGTLPHCLDVADAHVDLSETMQSDDAPPLPEHYTVHELGARRAGDEAQVRARVTSAIHEAPDAESVLVLGDGPGEHAREFAARGKTVTLVETPDVVKHVTPLLAHESIEVDARPLDEFLPTGFDLVFVPRAFRTRGPEANQALVGRVATAIGTGGDTPATESGAIAVFVDAFRETHPDAAALDAELLATTGGGRVYDRATARDWVADAGFHEVRSVEVPGTGAGAVVGEARH